MRSTVRRPADAPTSAPALLLFPPPHAHAHAHAHTHTHAHALAHTVPGVPPNTTRANTCNHFEPKLIGDALTPCSTAKLPSLAVPDEGFRPLARGDEEALLARMPDVDG